jgi:nucleotide-binding universal stress UspA family protein
MHLGTAAAAVVETKGKPMNGCIVVGTDGSDTATEALKTAIELARVFSQPLHVVSAYSPDRVSTVDIPAEYAEMVQPMFRVEAVLADAERRCARAGVEASSHPVAGNAANAILAVAEKVNADLIVVGNRGIASKKRFLVGNVPSKVVHHAPCATHVVHTT